MKQTPDFWYDKDNKQTSWRAHALRPLAWLYSAGAKINQRMQSPKRADIPVICIGNLNAGGTGKTPCAIAVMALIKAQGLASNPAFLLRGYGGSLKGPLRVGAGAYNPSHVGEEALMLAQHAETYISKDRYAGAQYAAAQGADLIVMDDGLQNYSLQRDLNLVVINGTMGFGNGRVMPAGPLREGLQGGLNKADGFIVVGADESGISAQLPKDVPVIAADLKTQADDYPPKDTAYFAFAGIGYPQKFYSYARDVLGLEISQTLSFADHHAYDEDDIKRLRSMSDELGLMLLTTEKDYQKIRFLNGAEDLNIEIVPVHMVFNDEDILLDLIKRAISA